MTIPMVFMNSSLSVSIMAFAFDRMFTTLPEFLVPTVRLGNVRRVTVRNSNSAERPIPPCDPSRPRPGVASARRDGGSGAVLLSSLEYLADGYGQEKGDRYADDDRPGDRIAFHKMLEGPVTRVHVPFTIPTGIGFLLLPGLSLQHGHVRDRKSVVAARVDNPLAVGAIGRTFVPPGVNPFYS